MARVPASTLAHYRRFSLYNSPYPAHERGRAIDLYPVRDLTPSPVAGVVRDVRRLRAPSKPYAPERDVLLLVELDRPQDRFGLPEGSIARILHVDPLVDPGATIDVGDPLGRLLRSGFFAPWVDNHLHLEFRSPDRDPYRARGSRPIDVEVGIDPLRWDGTGTVVERAASAVVLDSPPHPAPGDRFAALAAADGTPLDGGLVHYPGGGALSPEAAAVDTGDAARLSLLGCSIGTARDRHIDWDDVAVVANGEPITGLSLFVSRQRAGVKLVWPDHDCDVGDRVTVELEPTDDPVVLADG